MSTNSLNSSYLPHVNGLRALAILGVLIYHLQSGYCPAGYFGVDLFLVISGFLLFRSLLKPGVEQQFHYGSYLLKKIWRIVPLWFLVTMIVCGVSLCLLHPGRLTDILKTAHYSSFFLADFHIDRSGDYFNIFSQQNPLLHYWYLSITMQLYIVAPLLVIPLMRWRSRKAAIILLSVLALLSLLFYFLSSPDGILSDTKRATLLHAIGAKTAYYHLVPRLWEIIAGATILLLPEFGDKTRLRTALGLIGIAGIIISYYLYGTGSPAIYLTVVSSLLALRYASSGIAGKLLSLAPLQAVGTISFSLYLWHWPVMVFWKYCRFDAPGIWDELGMLVVSFLLALISWRLIERLPMPTRKGTAGVLLRSLPLLCILISLLTVPKLVKHSRKAAATLAQQTMQQYPPTLQFPREETDAHMLSGLEAFKAQGLKGQALRFGTTNAPCSLLLIGDSHSQQLYDALHQQCEKEGLRGIYFRDSLCPFWNLERPLPTTGDLCCWNQHIAAAMLNYLRRHEDIHYVIVALYWDYRLTDMYHMTTSEMKKKLNAAFNVSLCRDLRTGKPLNTPAEYLSLAEAGLGEFCDQVRALGKEVILLGDNPTFDAPSPLDEWERCKQFNIPYKGRELTEEEHHAKQAVSHRILRSLAASGRAHYIDLAIPLKHEGVYPARLHGDFLYRDCDHLLPAGTQRTAAYFMTQLRELIRQRNGATTQPTP